MQLDPGSAYWTELGGTTYYFCSPSCKARFKKAYFEKTRSAPPKVRRASGGGGGSCH